ncbi:MAG: ComEC/Rec2 family competence protein [Salegentibacter sp.]
MKFFNLTFIKLSLALLFGVIFRFYFPLPGRILFPFLALIFTIFILGYFKTRNQLFQQPLLFGIPAYLLIFSIGMASVYLHDPHNQPQHYIHHLRKNTSTTPLLKLKIKERLKPTISAERYIAETEAIIRNPKEITSEKIHGKLLLNISGEVQGSPLIAGEEFLVPFYPEDIQKPLNPFQFDYAQYMKHLGVEKQMSLHQNQLLKVNNSSFDIYALAGRLRSKISRELKQHELSPEELAIIQALLLGQRQDISSETYASYSAAGAVHILAVSGLHVGIILLLLTWLLQPLGNSRPAKLVRTILLLLLMWGFALIAGLSPSITRAVMMFSFIAIGMQLQRPVSVMNSLFVSLFILLLINPSLVFQVGFQLSYLAVFAIIAFQPKMRSLFEPKSKLARFFWNLTTVSIAAQLGVLPLSLYYFHQFPGLFFLSNLVILPFLGVILGAGILLILLALLHLLPDLFVQIYARSIDLLNAFVNWVAAQQSFLLKDIPFSLIQTLSAYFFLLCLLLLLYRKNFRNVVLLLSAVVIFQMNMISEKMAAETSEAVIFHKTGRTLIAVQGNKKLQLFQSKDFSEENDKIMTAYKVNRQISQVEENRLPSVMKLESKRVLVVDSSGVYDLAEFQPELVLLRNSPRINLNRLLKKLHPQQVIADGSNYTSYIRRWEATCKKQKVPFYFTGKKGAFLISGEQ